MIKDADKIRLADMVLGLVSDIASENSDSKKMPIQIGTLKRGMGYLGLKKAGIGTPVYEFEERYVIYFETLDGKTTVVNRYYKNELFEQILELTT